MSTFRRYMSMSIWESQAFSDADCSAVSVQAPGCTVDRDTRHVPVRSESRCCGWLYHLRPVPRTVRWRTNPGANTMVSSTTTSSAARKAKFCMRRTHGDSRERRHQWVLARLLAKLSTALLIVIAHSVLLAWDTKTSTGSWLDVITFRRAGVPLRPHL